MPERESVEQLVRASIARALQVEADAIPLEATIDQLGVDSIVAMGLIIDLETRLQVTVPVVGAEPLHGTSRVADVVSLFEQLVASQPQTDRRQ